MEKKFRTLQGIAMLALGLSAANVQSLTIERDFSGNDCAGYFGTPFDACTIFVNDSGVDIELSPVIAKYDYDETGNMLSLDDTNGTVYPSIDGSEFSFPSASSEYKTGSWNYSPGTNDPGVRFWATKAGPDFRLFWEVDDAEVLAGGACDVADVYTLSCLSAAMVVSSGDWSTNDNKALSHITFYDTEMVVPVPAAVWLMLSGLTGLYAAGRRRGT